MSFQDMATSDHFTITSLSVCEMKRFDRRRIQKETDKIL